MNTTLSIPGEQALATQAIQCIEKCGGMNDFWDIPKERDRQDVKAKLQAMLMLDAKVAAGCQLKEAKAQTARFFQGYRGISGSSLQNYYQLWRKGGQKTDSTGKRTGEFYRAHDWRIFVSNWNNGDVDAVLTNKPFCTYVTQLFADTTRKDATGNAVFERLLDIWYQGDDIPGFGNIREWCAQHGRPVPDGNIRRAADTPKGWSARNISRILPQSTAKRIYIQRGEHAAHSHWGDQLLRDRGKLMPFQLITFDDVRFDIQVMMPINGHKAQTVFPQAIFALDVATGLILAKGVMGAYTREIDTDGGRKGSKRAFQQADMRWLVTSILERYGLPKDWQVKMLLENASASLSVTDMRMFHELTGIEFENTGLVRRKLFQSGFIEQGGMPWQKGWIESFFRLLHCRINHLEGTMGRRYDLTPGSMKQTVKYAIQCVHEAQEKNIPISELDLPILTLAEFHTLLDEYVMRLNFRVNHHLQGFDEVHEHEVETGKYLRWDDPMARAIVPPGAMWDTRIEAPIERAMRLMKGHEMTPIHPRQLLPLGMEKREITVRNEHINISVSSISRDKLIFRDEKCAPMLAQYNRKEDALLGLVAHDARCIHLFTNDENLTWVGSPANVQRVDMTDETAILCRAGEVDRARQVIRDDVATLLEPKNEQYDHMRRHNKAVLGGTTPIDRISTAIETAETKQHKKAVKTKTVQQRINEAEDIDPAKYMAAAQPATTDVEDTDEDIDRYFTN